MKDNSTNASSETNWLVPSVLEVALVRKGELEARPVFRTLTDCAKLFRGLTRNSDREMFLVACFTAEYRLIGVSTLSVGTQTATAADAGMVLKVALLSNAAAIMISHNHPCLPAKPSGPDLDITDQIGMAAMICGIELRDHLIIGEWEWYSLREEVYGRWGD